MKQYLLPLLMSIFLIAPAWTAVHTDHEPYPIQDENRLVPDTSLETRFETDLTSPCYSLDSVESVSRLVRSQQERLTVLLNRQRGLASRHHWEFGARIDRNRNGKFSWIDMKSSKGTGNRTTVSITNRTVICFHTHPAHSIPQLSFHDRENARKAYRKLCEQCRGKGIPEPEAAWFVTVHEDGEMWAWRPGMNRSVQL